MKIQIALLAIFCLLLAGCSDDDEKNEANLPPREREGKFANQAPKTSPKVKEEAKSEDQSTVEHKKAEPAKCLIRKKKLNCPPHQCPPPPCQQQTFAPNPKWMTITKPKPCEEQTATVEHKCEHVVIVDNGQVQKKVRIIIQQSR
jgi:hypothetical protein